MVASVYTNMYLHTWTWTHIFTQKDMRFTISVGWYCLLLLLLLFLFLHAALLLALMLLFVGVVLFFSFATGLISTFAAAKPKNRKSPCHILSRSRPLFAISFTYLPVFHNVFFCFAQPVLLCYSKLCCLQILCIVLIFFLCS